MKEWKRREKLFQLHYPDLDVLVFEENFSFQNEIIENSEFEIVNNDFWSDIEYYIAGRALRYQAKIDNLFSNNS